jgi:thiol-disulfide isomerase/thioredoxin
MFVYAVYRFVVWQKAEAIVTPREASVEAIRLVGQDGTMYDTRRTHDKPTVVVAWATWCSTECLRALESLSYTKTVYGDRIEALAINRKEDASIVEAYKTTVALPEHITYLDDTTDTYFSQIDGHAMPEVLVYAPDGTLAAHLIAAPSEEELSAILKTVIDS